MGRFAESRIEDARVHALLRGPDQRYPIRGGIADLQRRVLAAVSPSQQKLILPFISSASAETLRRILRDGYAKDPLRTLSFLPASASAHNVEGRRKLREGGLDFSTVELTDKGFPEAPRSQKENILEVA